MCVCKETDLAKKIKNKHTLAYWVGITEKGGILIEIETAQLCYDWACHFKRASIMGCLSLLRC